jgi:NarL family two-component system response regulator LiaR
MKTILDRLTPRQKEVALLIAQGKGNKEIAEEVTVSSRTIETHVSDILAITRCNRVELAVMIDRLCLRN